MGVARRLLVFVMGPTCAGKSSLLRLMKDRHPDKVGLVEVGKALRAKYPVDYFKGHNNPDHTAQEAWDLCVSEVERHTKEGKVIIVIDGQPRSPTQAKACASYGGSFSELDYNRVFLWLSCSLDEALQRAEDSRPEREREYQIARQNSDRIHNHDTLFEVMLDPRSDVRACSTSNPDNKPMDLVFEEELKMLDYEIRRRHFLYNSGTS